MMGEGETPRFQNSGLENQFHPAAFLFTVVLAEKVSRAQMNSFVHTQITHVFILQD